MKEDPRCIRTDFIPQPHSPYQNLPSILIDGNGLPFPTLGLLQMEKTSREIDDLLPKKDSHVGLALLADLFSEISQS